LNHPTEKGIIYGTGAWNKGEINGMPDNERGVSVGSISVKRNK
jgi:hypothetical protein